MRAALATLAVAAACTAGRAAAPEKGPAAPARPATCEAIAPGDDLAAAVAAARPGDALCLEAGAHRGPVRVGEGVTIWGPREALVRGDGAGAVIDMVGAGARVAGFTVDGQGGRFDRE